jgi:diguanylate cyclase (GGDEF)-like protein
METVGPFLLGVIVALGLLVPLVLRSRSVAAELGAQADGLEAEVERLTLAKQGLEEDQRFLNQFMKEFPHLARDLFAGLKEREVPGAVLQIVQKSLDPERSAVLVRRTGGGEPFVVAAVGVEAGGVSVGIEVPDAGDVGYAAESRMVVSRADLLSETAHGRVRPAAGPDPLAALEIELLAPLVFDQETLGVIALSAPRKTAGDGRAALRLIAQTGAQALHNAAAYSRIKVTAQMDGLTRIFNKRHMEQALSELIYRTACAAYDQRDGSAAQNLSVFLFDIDYFKHYNDTNGHLAGDRLLQELARIVPEVVSKDGVFGRFGGEEFLLVLPGAGFAQAYAAAERIRALVAAHPFPFAEKQPLRAVTVSGGVAEYPQHGRDAEGLLLAADGALYEAKRLGRNRVLAASAAAKASSPEVRTA